MKFHSSVCTPMALSSIPLPQMDAGRSRAWMWRRRTVQTIRYDDKFFFVFCKLLQLLRFCVVCTRCVMGTRLI